MELVVHKIQNEYDFNVYKDTVNGFEVVNPFFMFLTPEKNESTYDGLRYFTLKVEDKVLILMPFVLREIPYKLRNTIYYDVISPYGYSGPLFNKDMSRGYLLKFWELIDSWYKENNVVSEFIRFSLNNNCQFYSGTLIPTLSNVRGRLLDYEQQWASLKQKVRNNYRKAVNNNLKSHIVYNNVKDEDIERFYDIYISTMRRVNANTDYFYSLCYFKNIVRLCEGKIIFAFVYKDGIAISTELILTSNNTLYSYLGGTIMDYFSLRPNDFLKVEVMKWARLQHFKYYVLGGGREDFDNLYKYKKSFFPNDDDLVFYTGRKIINKAVYNELDKITNDEIGLDDGGLEKKGRKIGFFPAYRKNTYRAITREN
ncbi:GNAT family N-acetyltransferase [Oceanihabitans sp. IOP_32]|uniref:GNAT family N-acetyltransferase n=1 Tax=Oceanihabitans sp. IOP_32 TaxID=2529032 RepID=UPI001292DA26|nr:GNAT family N-acetyltransferase [Oceanihabitans sp. IOP_32]QFZ55888.1 GNAT family N-acetyltransferase [Oceanihabitans sp. IOP_32]